MIVEEFPGRIQSGYAEVPFPEFLGRYLERHCVCNHNATDHFNEISPCNPVVMGVLSRLGYS